ncbi:MAG: NAD-binding protein, partial [Cyanobacteria bacterium J06559_3]
NNDATEAEISASVASLFGILLTERGISGGDAIKALVFLTIIITVLSQGLTASLLARLLGVTVQKEGSGAVIVGCNPLSLLIARLVKEGGESVAMIDTNAEACEQAVKENVSVFVDSALETEVLEEAGLARAGTLLAITNNGDVNTVIAQQAQSEFQPPRIVSVVPEEAPEDPTNKKIAAKKTPSGQKSAATNASFPVIRLKTWNNYLNEGTVRLGETLLRAKGTLMQRAHLRALMRSGELIPILVKRDDRVRVTLQEDDWQVGDRILYLLHDPKPKLLQRLSGGSRPTRLNVETLPTVEEVPLPAKVVEVPPPPPPTETESLPTASVNGTAAATANSAATPPATDAALQDTASQDAASQNGRTPTPSENVAEAAESSSEAHDA